MTSRLPPTLIRRETLPALRRFLAWWQCSLCACLPRMLRERAGTLPCHVLEVDGEQLVLATPRPDGRWQRQPLPTSRPGNVATSRGLAGVRLLLDPSLVARRQLVLPLAAEENLRQVLEFEMDRRTPFRADEVSFHWRVLERSVANHALSLELVVVPRERLKEWRAGLAMLGLAAQHIDVVAGQPDAVPVGLGVDLLAGEAASAKGDTLARLQRGLAVVALGLLVAVLAVPAWRTQQAAEQLGDQVAVARADALAEADRLEALERRHGGLQQLLARRQREPWTVARLAELARVLPDDTWLQQLEIRDGRMILQGESARAAALIERLERSPLLGTASFEAPVDTDPTSGQERFRIALRLNSGGEP